MRVHAHFVSDKGLRIAFCYDTETDVVFCDNDEIIGCSYENDPDLFMANMASITLPDESVVFFNEEGEIIEPTHYMMHLQADLCNQIWEALS